MATTLRLAGKLAQTPVLKGWVVIRIALLIVIVVEALSASRGPTGFSLVSVRVTIPADNSAALALNLY